MKPAGFAALIEAGLSLRELQEMSLVELGFWVRAFETLGKKRERLMEQGGGSH